MSEQEQGGTKQSFRDSLTGALDGVDFGMGDDGQILVINNKPEKSEDAPSNDEGNEAGTDESGSQHEANTDDEGQPAEPKSDAGNWEQRFRDTQAAFTTSQQELAKAKGELSTLSAQVKELTARLDRQNQGGDGQPKETETRQVEVNAVVEALQDGDSQRAGVLLRDLIRAEAEKLAPGKPADDPALERVKQELAIRDEFEKAIRTYPDFTEYIPAIKTHLLAHPDDTMELAYLKVKAAGARPTTAQSGKGGADGDQGKGPRSKPSAEELRKKAEDLTVERGVSAQEGKPKGGKMNIGDAFGLALEQHGIV